MVTHGLAEYAAREEMGRDRGAWWSPDGGAIAFARVDVSAVPRFEVRGEERVERHAYPFAGCENAHVRLGVVDVSSLTFDRRNGRKTRATLRKQFAAFGGWIRDVDSPDDDARADHAFVSSHPDTFPVTWLDVECGTHTLGGRGPEEEYLVDVTWTPSENTCSRRYNRGRSADSKSSKSTRGRARASRRVRCSSSAPRGVSRRK